MKITPKFERSTREMNTAMEDAEGRIVIRISLRDESKGNAFVKGNITKHITIRGAKVSEVFEAIVEALFNEQTKE